MHMSVPACAWLMNHKNYYKLIDQKIKLNPDQ